MHCLQMQTKPVRCTCRKVSMYIIYILYVYKYISVWSLVLAASRIPPNTKTWCSSAPSLHQAFMLAHSVSRARLRSKSTKQKSAVRSCSVSPISEAETNQPNKQRNQQTHQPTNQRINKRRTDSRALASSGSAQAPASVPLTRPLP